MIENLNQLVSEAELAIGRLAEVPSAARRTALRQLHAKLVERGGGNAVAHLRANAALRDIAQRIGALAAIACTAQAIAEHKPETAGTVPATAAAAE